MAKFKPGDRIVYKEDEGNDSPRMIVGWGVDKKDYLVQYSPGNWDRDCELEGVPRSIDLIDKWYKLLSDVEDTINNPKHYTAGGVETIDFIEAKGLGYHLGNVVKYLSRAGIKSDDTVSDLKKARWYLDRYITMLEKDND